MDSLSQLALGASLSVAVMGRRTAVWKAAAWGALAGTLPDLDVLIRHGDPVVDMVRHRAETHSLFFLALLAWPLGWAVARATDTPANRWRWGWAFFASLVTHPLLDLMTVYGTQVLQPFTDEAYGVGSLFIIDPLYTVPLLIGLVWAVASRGGSSNAGLRANRLGLALSTAYIGWSVLAQAWATDHARRSLAPLGLDRAPLLVTPAPLNTVLWRLLVMQPDRYLEAHWSPFDGQRPIRWRSHPRDAALLQRQANHPQVIRLQRFSDGFFHLEQRADGRLWLTDLRMGQEPDYVFRFDIGPALPRPTDPHPVAVQHPSRTDLAAGLRWLRHRALGADVPPPGLSQSHATTTP